MRKLIILLVFFIFGCASAPQKIDNVNNNIPSIDLDKILNGRWEVKGFLPSQEQSFDAGSLLLEDARFEFKSSDEFSNNLEKRIIVTNRFVIDHSNGALECYPLIDEFEFENSLGKEDFLIARCIFYSGGQSSREHTISITESGILYFNEGIPGSLHLGSITKQFEN